MRDRGSVRSLGLLLAMAFYGVCFAGGSDYTLEKSEAEDMSKIVTAGEKKPFQWRSGDGVLTVGAKSTTEHRFAKNAVMLNDCIPDETGHFRQTVDAHANYAYGEKKYGHKAIELESVLRFKTIWGKIGYMAETEKNDAFKVLGASLGEHNHASTRSLVWIKNAWVKASINAALKMNSDKVHYLTFGMFPFHLGRGIALGPFYGVVLKDFLAIYSRNTDYSAPGVMLSGELVEDMLWYDLYYAKLEEKSASFGDVFNSVKEKVIGRRTTPWSGPAKDSDLFAARLKIKPVDSKNFGTVEFEPYIYYNEASNQKVEMIADSKSMLGAVGLAAEYTNKNFEFGGEVAFNYGHQDVFGIDRNIVMLKTDTYADTDPSVHEVYSHVYYEDPQAGSYNGKNVLVGSNSESAIVENRKTNAGCTYNSTVWTPDPVDYTGHDFKNADDRYRPCYKNEYRGWMGVVDASYLFDSINLKFAATYGYASGDRNPHCEETNKNYKGFVGLYELYAGKRVPSVFVLDARKTRRPLTIDSGETEADSDPSFTDLQYVGVGATWKPSCLKKYKFSVNPNLLFFWKEHEAYKYDNCNNVFTCDKADKFLGTEFNIITSKEIIKDLTISSNFAMFIPGSYYKDVRGVPMKGILFNKLEEADKADLPSSSYTLGDDTAFYTQIAVSYKF